MRTLSLSLFALSLSLPPPLYPPPRHPLSLYLCSSDQRTSRNRRRKAMVTGVGRYGQASKALSAGKADGTKLESALRLALQSAFPSLSKFVV